MFTHRDLAEVTRRSARPASPARLYRAQWGSNRVETVFLRKPTDWRNAGLSRNYSDLRGFQQFRAERQKPIPANSIGFLRKEKTRVFCEAAAPHEIKPPEGTQGVGGWRPRLADTAPGWAGVRLQASEPAAVRVSLCVMWGAFVPVRPDLRAGVEAVAWPLPARLAARPRMPRVWRPVPSPSGWMGRKSF